MSAAGVVVERARPTPRPATDRSSVRTAAWIAIAALLIFAISGGGRLSGSDEVTMFELGRSMLRGGIAVPVGATLDGRDGRHYTKNAAGQAILALPLTLASEKAAEAAHLSDTRRTLAVRFGVSFFNAVVTAVLLGWFYFSAQLLGASAGGALAATALLGFTTPLWVSAKSFAAEPLEALGLLMALTACGLVSGPRRSFAGRFAALGILVSVSSKPSMLPFAILCMLPLLGRPLHEWRWPLAGLLLALAGHAVYDAARFGTPFETGYGRQATPAAYTTPILVGLYGLLLSSGKGIAWFAPTLWLAPAGWRRMTRGQGLSQWRAADPATRVAWVALGAWIFGLLFYGGFQHWAGDGSFGPRYLVPLLPLGLLTVAFALTRPSRALRRAAMVLGVLGLVVQIGGVAIHFGAQMREAGDYPYRLPLDDPHFMSESHFNPRFSPIAGHWRMLARNAAEHARGELPRLTAEGTPDPRVGISAEDQTRLLHALDFWWLYALYAGVGRAPILVALLVLIAATVLALTRLRLAWRTEARAG